MIFLKLFLKKMHRFLRTNYLICSVYACLIFLGFQFLPLDLSDETVSQDQSNGKRIIVTQNGNKQFNKPSLNPITLKSQPPNLATTSQTVIKPAIELPKSTQDGGSHNKSKKKSSQRRAYFQEGGADRQMVPPRRIVHFDLKGAPPRPTYFLELFPVLRRLGATGILLEWEDMFPYKRTLTSARNRQSYTENDVEMLLKAAKSSRLEIIPLVQTFGHLEWILKLEEFAHLRQNPEIPQVICVGSEQAWDLITEMLDLVANIHKPFGLSFFHIGADEAFELGLCGADRKLMDEVGGKETLILWHISRVARYLREKHNVSILAWHDMFLSSYEDDLKKYNMTEIVEPVIWSYTEDINGYMYPDMWQKLFLFPNIWAASAFKGADGPARYYSNPKHYIANHKSWIQQFQVHHEHMKQFRGVIMTGWSRYDHFAVLCEIFPVGLPSLAYNLLVVREKQSFTELEVEFECKMHPNKTDLEGCNFPGVDIYTLVHKLKDEKDNVKLEIYGSDEFQGWLSKTGQKFNFSSAWYMHKLLPKIGTSIRRLKRIKTKLRREMKVYFYEDAVNEFILQYLQDDLDRLETARDAANVVIAKRFFQIRPIPELLDLSV